MLKRRPPEVEYIPPGQMGAGQQEGGVSTGAVLGILGALAAGAIGVAAAASSRKSAAPMRGARLGAAPRKRKCNCGR